MNSIELFEKKTKIKINNKVSFCSTSVEMNFIGGKWKSVYLKNTFKSGIIPYRIWKTPYSYFTYNC